MREIKFRAWTEDTKTMFLITNLDLEKKEWSGKWIKGSGAWAIRQPLTNLMQYTGLKDKNGVEIYEGDIMRNEGDKIDEVIFYQGCFCYKLADRRYHIFDQNMGEVIGNIYENPELLER